MFALMLMKMLSKTLNLFSIHCFHLSLEVLWQQKPKPYQTSLIVTAALVGWQLIGEKVLRKFGKCKHHQFVSILHLLEHVVPLVFCQRYVTDGHHFRMLEKETL